MNFALSKNRPTGVTILGIWAILVARSRPIQKKVYGRSRQSFIAKKKHKQDGQLESPPKKKTSVVEPKLASDLRQD